MSTTATTTTSSTPTASTNADLNVSLEPHLIELLLPLLPVLPQPLHTQLASVLPGSDINTADSTPVTNSAPRIVSYALLSSISTWSRSPSGRNTLQNLSPSLQSNAYTMVSLLAGTRTSPERKFPKNPMTEAVDPDEESRRDRSDRRAITALLNALLSIIGSGAATWWAADRLHWKDEWKVLLGLLVAMVVAISEGVLYLIWDSRRSKSKSLSRRTHKILNARRVQGVIDAKEESVPSEDTNGPSAGSTKQDPDGASQQQLSIADLPTTNVPPAQANIQIHTTNEGLRERGGGRRS